MNPFAQQLLERPASNDDCKEVTLHLKGTADTVDKCLKLLSTASYLGNVGSSREIKISVDGDGHERLEVELEGGEIPDPPSDCADQDVIYCG